MDNSEYAKNIIVVFWSDNGYHCGEKNHWEKNTLWEQATHTPMAIRIPGSNQNGNTTLTPVNLIDLYPTIVDYCQLKAPKQSLDGVSLRPSLENTAYKWNRTALTTFGEGFASVRGNQYRYITYSDGSEELYDHFSDPFEFNNLASDPAYKNVIKRLKKDVPRTFKPALKGRRS